MKITNEIIYEKLQDHDKMLAILIESHNKKDSSCDAKHKAVKNETRAWVLGGVITAILLYFGVGTK